MDKGAVRGVHRVLGLRFRGLSGEFIGIQAFITASGLCEQRTENLGAIFFLDLR